MKKILSLLALMMLTMASAWAGEVATFDLGTKNGVSTPAGFFKSVGEKWNWNSKFNGAEYDGISFSQGLKMEGSTKIGFTTEYPSTVTIVQSTWSANTITLDGNELDVNGATAGTGCRIYTVKDVAAGDHVIGRGSGESGLFYVKVEWETKKTVTFINDANWEKVFVWAWNDTENFTGGEWPGVELTPDATGTYSWETVGSPTMIIFNNGGDQQTPDLPFKDGGVYNSKERVITLQKFTATFKTDGMDEVYAYAWNDSEKPLGEWPGTKMEGGNGEFTIAIQAEDAPKYIIFHNNAGEQTSDLTFEDGKVYEFMLNEYTVTFTTDAGWTDVYAWAWTETGEYKKNFSESWPGEKLEGTDGVYTYSVKSFEAPHNILFNNGSDEGKTADLAFVDGKAYKWITATPYYALKEGDTFAAGTTVDLGDATITYGVEGGAAFGEATAAVNEDYAGFAFMTGGNGENGSATSGTVYTIVPKYDGTITVGVRLNGGKKMHINEDGTDLADYAGITIKDAANTTFDFAVKAGSTYKIWCDGSKLGFFGFDYKFTQPEVSITAVDLMGSSNEWAEPIATFGVEDASTGYWALNDVQFAANDEFKVRVSYSDQTYKWLAPASEGNFLVNEEQLNKVLALEENTPNMYVEKAATLSFALNPGFTELTITGEFAGTTLNTYTVKFENNGNWAEVYAYAWTASDAGIKEFLGSWPGKKIEASDEGYVVTIEAEEAPEKIIFNNGGDLKTADLDFENGKTYTYAAPVEGIIPSGTYYVMNADAGKVVNAESKLDVKGTPITFTFDAATNTYAIAGAEFFNDLQWTIAEAYEGMSGYYTISTVKDNKTQFLSTGSTEESIGLTFKDAAGDDAVWILLQQAYWEDIVNSTYTVVGTKNLTGTEEDWAIVEANEMTYNDETGLFEKKFEKIAVDANNQPEFKIFKKNMDGVDSWYPDNNWVITPDYVGGEGLYDITITFDPSDFKEIGVIAEKILMPEDIYVLVSDGDISEALARAIEGKKVGNITIELNKESNAVFTISSSITVPNSLTIWGNDQKIDASALEGPFIAMENVDDPKEWKECNIEIDGVKVTGLKKALFFSTCKNYLIKDFNVNWVNCELADDVTAFDFTKGSVAVNFNVVNSTFYAPTATTKSFYSSQAGQKATEAGDDYTQTFLFHNNTMYNLAKAKNFFTHRQSNQKWLAYDVQNNIFVNCGKSGQTIKGMNGGQGGANPVWTIIGNAFNFDGADTSAAEETGDTDEPVQNSVAGVVTFVDAENGDFNGEIQLAEGAEYPAAIPGAPMWNINIKLAPVVVDPGFYLVGTMNDWTPSSNFMMAPNDAAQPEDPEYMITLDLEAGAQFKVVSVDENQNWIWYPGDGIDNCSVNDAGNYTIYCRPNGNDEWTTWKYVYAQYNGPSTGINGIYAEKLQNATIYNLNGQRVQNVQKGLYIINGKKVMVK